LVFPFFFFKMSLIHVSLPLHFSWTRHMHLHVGFLLKVPRNLYLLSSELY
jgi:hypothetical protein